MCPRPLTLSFLQNSTLLWETVDPEVMDAAVATHHEVLRTAMYAHAGRRDTKASLHTHIVCLLCACMGKEVRTTQINHSLGMVIPFITI